MKTKRVTALLMVLAMLLTLGPPTWAANEAEQLIELTSYTDYTGGTKYQHSAKLNKQDVEEFTDYVWHADPAADHSDEKNAPAEYYTGTKPNTDAAVYISHDIVYYPSLPAEGFQMLQYDEDREWCYFYPASSAYHEYIFATLPAEGNSVPERMMHTPEEAFQNAVLHIQKPGTYRIQGEWHGQILVDLGDEDETFRNPDAKVRLILDGVTVTCTVAPALIFQHVYECDNQWEERSEHSASVDTSNAGAQVVIADGSQNTFTGENVYRMLRTAYKSEDSQNSWSTVKVQKKQRKIDGAFYSFVTMQIDGEDQNTGVLNIHAGFEGLDTELHLTVKGGNVNIFSQDDGINVNEDNVSVLTFDGGNVHILAGLGMEGDGIDSNGYMVVNGGTLITMANPRADSGMDSERGTFINGGTVVALGSTMDWAEAGDKEYPAGSQAAMNLQFASAQSADEAIIITNAENKVIFAYDPDKDEVAEGNARWYQGAIVSSSQIKVGSPCHVYVGGDVSDGIEKEGVYDPATVSGFTQDAKQQCYSKTGVFTRPGPPPDGGPGAPPPGGPGAPPPDFDPNNPPPPGGPGFALANKNGKREFVMSGAVNGFQAVTDYVGAIFEDVPEGHAFYDAIQWADGTGVAERASDTTFAPDTLCTRGQTVLYLWRAAGSPLIGSFGGSQMPPANGLQPDVNGNPTPMPQNGGQSADAPPPGGPQQPANGLQPGSDGPQPPANPNTQTNPFTDIAENSPYYNAILWAVQSGITDGTTPTTFEPDRTVTRAQSQTFLYRWIGKPTASGDNPFQDVHEGRYYYDAVRWSVQNGITHGKTDTTFEPDTTLTKGQMLTFLYRFVEADLLPNMMGPPPGM